MIKLFVRNYEVVLMMNFDFTNEDLEILRKYRGQKSLAINQLLVSNSEIDLNILLDSEEDSEAYKFYTKGVIKENIKLIKDVYSVMLKAYYNKTNKEAWALSYGTTVTEIERLKNEIYIDNFLATTSNKEEIKKQIAGEMPALLNIAGDGNIPILNVDEVLGNETKEPEILVSPFTKIKEFKENEQIALEDERILRIYSITLEKQDLQDITKAERQSIYDYIIASAEVVNQKLKETVISEREKIETNEEIRKLEGLLSKYELEITKKIQAKDYPETERDADEADVNRIKENISSLKDKISSMFEEKKMAMDFITKWKKNISVYLMAEFKSLEMEYEADAKVQNLHYNEKMKKLEEEAIKKHEQLQNETLENIAKAVNKECDENIIEGERLVNDIQRLIVKQQNHAKIAENMGATYSALNNSFEMKKNAEILLAKIKEIKEKAKNLCETEDRDLLSDKLLAISNVNLQINTLMNYLNNPKSAIRTS